MDSTDLGAIAAGQQDPTGPTMMFVAVVPWTGGSRGAAGVGKGDASETTKEETDEIAGRLQQVHDTAQ